MATQSMRLTEFALDLESFVGGFGWVSLVLCGILKWMMSCVLSYSYLNYLKSNESCFEKRREITSSTWSKVFNVQLVIAASRNGWAFGVQNHKCLSLWFSKHHERVGFGNSHHSICDHFSMAFLSIKIFEVVSPSAPVCGLFLHIHADNG
jgi:hypothetical protein